MNKDHLKGSVKETAGKIQEKTGKLMGSHDQEAKGLEKQIAGKAQKRAGDVKEAIKDIPKHH
ncbi:CsbD family protein [Glaciimonas sp. GG7]